MDYPKSLADVYLHDGKFTDGDADGSIPPSRDPAKWANDVTDTLLLVQAWTGEAPNEADLTQLKRGIDARIAEKLAAGGGAVVIRPATFAAGVVDGKPVRWDVAAGKFTLALADGTVNDLALGIADVINGAVYTFGLTPAGLVSGLVPGARYYLGADGSLVTAAPADAVKIGVAISATVLMVDIDAAPASGSVGKHTISVPAGAMSGRITGAPEPSAFETATNRVNLRTWNFDAAGREYVQFVVPMPKSWNLGTLTAQFIWSHGAASSNFGAAWAIQALALSDLDAADAAWGAAVQVNDGGGTVDAIYMTAESGPITVSGAPAAGDMVVFQAYRVADDAVNDTLAVDARLIGVRIGYITNAATDA